MPLAVRSTGKQTTTGEVGKRATNSAGTFLSIAARATQVGGRNEYYPDAMYADAADDSFSEELFEAAKIALTHGMSLAPPLLTNGNQQGLPARPCS